MTRAQAHFNRGKLALILSAAMLLSTMMPVASVLATNHVNADPDGVVVLVQPRFGTLVGDNKVAVASSDNMFLFDFQLVRPDGSAFLVSEIMVDIHTIDGRADPNAEWPTLIWTDRISLSPTSTGTVGVPANEVIFFTPKDHNGYNHEFPFGGMSFTIHAMKDESGNSLERVGGHFPNGHHSLLANNLYAQGVRGDELDKADETFTPVLLFNGQLSGLTQFGNPVLNPGFEIGFDESDFARIDDPVGGGEIVPGFSTAIPPWFLINTADNSAPESKHHIQGAAGSSGSAGAVHYSTADNGKSTAFGQFFFVPGANSPGPWHGTGSTKIEFDIRAFDNATVDVMTSPYHGCVTLHWNDTAAPGGEAQATRCPAGGVPLDNQWRHVVLDFGAVASQKQLNSMFFSFNLDYATVPSGTQLIVHFDNVRITGVKVADRLEPRTDGTDGYSTFIFPAAEGLGDSADQVVARLANLAGSRDAYVFRVAAVDYTGIDPAVLDLGDSVSSVFQLLDQDNVHPEGRHDAATAEFHAITGGANGAAFMNFYEPDGSISDDYLVVVPASFAGSTLVPWFFTDIVTGDEYTGVFGDASPAGAYYSPVRNNLMLSHLADSLDYAFTPVTFANTVGASLSQATQVKLSCPAQAVNVQCAADPNPDLVVAVSSASRVLETMEVAIVSDALGAADPANFTDGVLATGTVSLPSGAVTLTLSDSVMENLTAIGDMRVYATVGGALFSDDAETHLFALDNFAPVADFTSSDLTNVVKGTRVTFTSTSFDNDGQIVRHSWKLELLGDPSADLDPVPPGVIAAGNGTSISAVIPDDGNYRVTLTVRDNGGAEATKTLDFTAANQPPQISISGPQFGQVGEELTFTYTISDADGLLALNHRVHNGFTWQTRTLAAPIITSFPTNGTHKVLVQAWDDDGATTTKAFSVLLDNSSPFTSIQVMQEAPNATDGWFSGPVEYVVSRGDQMGPGIPSSGVDFTTLTVALFGATDPVSAEVLSGEDNITRTLAADGHFIVTAVTTDRAGNSDALAGVNATIKIDTSKPTVRILQPQLLDGASPIAAVVFTDQLVDIVVDAVDPHSPIKKVQFFVDGGDAVGVDADASDGWSFKWQASGTGTHEIAVVATNAAGLKEISQTITIVVV